jgi:hypothetical protein
MHMGHCGKIIELWWIFSPVRLQERHRFMVFLWQSTSEYLGNIGATILTDSGNKRLGLLY